VSIAEVVLEELASLDGAGGVSDPTVDWAPAATPVGASPATGSWPLIEALDDPDPAVAAFAAGLAGRTPDAGAIPHLARLLGSQHSRVSLMAAHGLEQLRDNLPPASHADALRRFPWLRSAAAHVLGRTDEDSSVCTLDALRCDAGLQDVLIAAWQRCAPRDAVNLLTGIIRRASDVTTLAACLRALGELIQRQQAGAAQRGVEEWVRLVLAEADVPDCGARLAHALVGNEEPAPPERGVKRLVAAVAWAFANRPLYAILVLAGLDPAVKETLACCPVDIGQEHTPALLAGLASEAAGVRALSARCIAATPLPEAAPGVEPLLQDSDDRVRATAVHALAGLRYDAAIPAIVHTLRDPSRLVRDAALLALARLDAGTVSIYLLCETIGTGTLRVRALSIMRANPHPDQRPFVQSCLSDRRPAVRQAAVAALARLAAGDLADLLRPLVTDPVLEVRAEAAAALARSRDPVAHDVLAAHLDGEAAALRSQRAADGESAAPDEDEQIGVVPGIDPFATPLPRAHGLRGPDPA